MTGNLNGRRGAGQSTMVFLVALLSISGSLSPGQSQTVTDESRLKAVFLFNFIKLVRWPEEHMMESFTISTLGNSPINEYLLAISGKRTIRDKKINVRRIQSDTDIQGSQLLFIANDRCEAIEETITLLLDPSLLVVSECQAATELGVDLNFIVIDGKVQFEANFPRLEQAVFKASSHLLRLARTPE